MPPAYIDDLKSIESKLKTYPSKQAEEIKLKNKLLADFDFIREASASLADFHTRFNLEKALPDSTTHHFTDEKSNLLQKYYKVYFTEETDTLLKTAELFLTLKHRFPEKIAEGIKARQDVIVTNAFWA